MTNALEIRGLTKRFAANVAVDDISFSVPEGSVFGFIGANGAGKTTTMKMILGLLRADSGEVWVCSEKATFGATKTNRHVGYLPDVPAFYGYLRPLEYLRLCGEVVGLEKRENARRAAELLQMVGLAGVHKKISSFSRGMRQRLGLAQALVNRPRLLICDEPTSALDPVGRKEVLDILAGIREQTTVLFSTHILADVERVCDRVAVIDAGRIVLEGTLAELKSRHRPDSLAIEFANTVDRDRFVALSGALWGEDRAADGLVLTLKAADVSEVQRQVLRILSENDILPIRLEVLEPSVESLFLEAAATAAAAEVAE